MKSENDNGGIEERGITRRQLLQAGALVGVGAGLFGGVLTACGGASGSAASSAASPAAGTVKAGGVMTIAHDSMSPTDNLKMSTNMLDPIDMLQGMLREGLVTYDTNWKIIPRLASSYEANADFTEYTFHMRPNVKFHDGTPFTAKDAAWTYLRILDPKEGSDLYGRVSKSLDASGVQVVDDMTLKLKLKHSDSLLPLTLASQLAYIVKENTTDYDAGIGTGPFTLKSFTPGTSYEVAKNPSYWASGQPYLDGVRVIFIPEASTKLQSVATGSADLTPATFDQIAVIKANPALVVTQRHNALNMTAIMDCRKKPFTDSRVREAMKRSIDREMVKRIAFADFGALGPDVDFTTEDPWMTPELTARLAMDRAKAQELMTAAGYPNGVDLVFKVPGDSGWFSNYGLAIAAALKGSPFRVKSLRTPAATYWDQVWLKDEFCLGFWNARHPIETMALQVGSTSDWNESHWIDPHMDELIAKAQASGGAELDAATSAASLYIVRGQRQCHPRLYSPPVGRDQEDTGCRGSHLAARYEANGLRGMSEPLDPLFAEAGLEPIAAPPRGGGAAIGVVALLRQRVVPLLVTLLLISIIVFGSTHVLGINVAKRALGRDATMEQLAHFNQQHGLNRPIYAQYGTWLWGFVRADFGTSALSDRPVKDIIIPRLVNTLILAAASIIIAVPLSISFGIYLAHPGSRLREMVLSTSNIALAAVAPFVVGIVLIYVFSVVLGWTPVDSLGLAFGSPAQKIAAFILPTATLVIGLVPHISRLTQVSIRETMTEPYARAAVLRGLSRRTIVYKHLMPNAAGPIVNVVALDLIWLVGGVIIVENVFGFPGLGSLLVTSLTTGDLITVQAVAVITGFLFICIGIMADVLVPLLNPRLRSE